MVLGKLNSGPLREQCTHLTAKSSLQPISTYFYGPSDDARPTWIFQDNPSSWGSSTTHVAKPLFPWKVKYSQFLGNRTLTWMLFIIFSPTVGRSFRRNISKHGWWGLVPPLLLPLKSQGNKGVRTRTPVKIQMADAQATESYSPGISHESQ